jgi:hypothetical protein
METFKLYGQKAKAWLWQPKHQKVAQDLSQEVNQLSQEVNRAFTEHPHHTGETYWQHLWFTTKMSGRFLYAIAVLMIHGLFPFLLVRAGSTEIEHIYRIMKSRIPKPRLDEIDLDYHV